MLKWSDQELEHVAKCPVCDCVGSETLYDDLVDLVFEVSRQKWSLHRCLDCDCAYLNPRPTRSSIHKAYTSYYTHQSSFQEEGELEGVLRKIKRVLANGYRNQRYGTSYQQAWKIGAMLIRMLPAQRRLIDRGMRNIPYLDKGDRILDVGFGDASYLRLLANGGWQVSGADPDAVVVKSAQDLGLDVREGGIEAFVDCQNCFKVITLSNVIEHVHDPVEMLQRAFSLLKPGGYLWLDTPNINGPLHKLFTRHWRGLEPPRHLLIFSRKSLLHALNKSGYIDIEEMPYAPGVISGRAAASREIAKKEGVDVELANHYLESMRDMERLEASAMADAAHRDSLTFMCRKPDETA